MRSDTQTELDQLAARVEELEHELERARAGADRARAEIISEIEDPICQLDDHLRYVYVNRAFEHLAGIGEDRLIGRTPAEAGVPFAAEWMETLTGVQRSGERARRTDELRKNGGASVFETRFAAVRSTAGKVDRITAITREITDETRTARELEHARNRLDSIVNSISESFVTLDRDWRFTYINTRGLEQTRRSREELIGKRLWEIFPYVRESKIAEEFEHVMQERVASRFEVAFEEAQRWFAIHAHPSDGGIAAYIIEITEWKKSEQALRDAHETLRALVHASPLPIISFNPDGNITVWNEAAERTFGWSADEVIGRPLPFIPEDKIEEHHALRARDLSGHGFTGMELRRRRKDGSPIDLSVSTAPIPNETGSVVAVVAVYEDITERKGIERELRESARLLREREEALRLSTDAAQVGIWSYDVAEDRLKLSALAAKLIGFPEDAAEIGVRDFLERVHEADRQRVKENIRETLERRNEYSDEYRIASAGGETRWVTARGLATLDTAGHKVRFSGVINDTTERKSVEQELARHAQELARSNADLQQFAFVTSHDLQEPLRTITAYAQLLARRCEGRLDADGHDYLNFIVDGATRMQRLINDLLAFSRVLHGPDRASAEVDMETVFAWAVMNLNKSIKETGAEITHETLPSVTGNQQEMVLLMQNLLGNALKYHGSDAPRIHVSAEPLGDEIRFSIRDNGIGIDAAYHEQIFGVFKRLHGKDVPGTGIGLALAKRIVEKHGGRIWVESVVGDGATFYFTLPQ